MQLDSKFQFSHNYFAELTNEQRMWRAVIVMAYKDAIQTDRNGQPPVKGTLRNARLSARQWIRHNIEDFNMVCQNAAVEDPENCRRALIAAINQNDASALIN